MCPTSTVAANRSCLNWGGGGGGDVEQIVVLGDVMFLCIVEEACY